MWKLIRGQTCVEMNMFISKHNWSPLFVNNLFYIEDIQKSWGVVREGHSVKLEKIQKKYNQGLENVVPLEAW